MLPQAETVCMKTLALGLLPAALLIGCSDVNLQPVAPVEYGDEPTVPSTGADADAPGDGSGDSSGGGARGPWDGLDPGNLPEEYFAVAWRPEPCDDCWDDDFGVENGHRFDVVDLEGRVIVSLERPFQDPGLLFERFEPGADGTLLVVEAQRNDTAYYQPSVWQRRVWRANAVTEETVEVLRMSWDHVELLSGRSFPLQGYEARFAADPEDPDVVWIATGGDQWDTMRLVRVDVADPDAEPTFHALPSMSELFGVEDQQYWASTPVALEVARSDRDLEIVLTIEGAMVYADPNELPRGVLVYRPGDGTSEPVVNLRRRNYLADVRFGATGTDGGRIGSTALLQVGAPRAWCGEARFAQVDPATLAEPGSDPFSDPTEAAGVEAIVGSETSSCTRLGPLVDDAGPTFVYWGERYDSNYAYVRAPSRITVSHAGEDVWTWDRLRVGLGDTDFRLLGIERVLVP